MEQKKFHWFLLNSLSRFAREGKIRKIWKVRKLCLGKPHLGYLCLRKTCCALYIVFIYSIFHHSQWFYKKFIFATFTSKVILSFTALNSCSFLYFAFNHILTLMLHFLAYTCWTHFKKGWHLIFHSRTFLDQYIISALSILAPPISQASMLITLFGYNSDPNLSHIKRCCFINNQFEIIDSFIGKVITRFLHVLSSCHPLYRPQHRTH